MKNFLFYMGVFVFLFGIACIICELHMIFKESRLVKEINAWLALAVIFPIMLYFWPFAMWNDSMLLLLRIIPAIAA